MTSISEAWFCLRYGMCLMCSNTRRHMIWCHRLNIVQLYPLIAIGYLNRLPPTLFLWWPSFQEMYNCAHYVSLIMIHTQSETYNPLTHTHNFQPTISNTCTLVSHSLPHCTCNFKYGEYKGEAFMCGNFSHLQKQHCCFVNSSDSIFALKGQINDWPFPLEVPYIFFPWLGLTIKVWFLYNHSLDLQCEQDLHKCVHYRVTFTGPNHTLTPEWIYHV